MKGQVYPCHVRRLMYVWTVSVLWDLGRDSVRTPLHTHFLQAVWRKKTSRLTMAKVKGPQRPSYQKGQRTHATNYVYMHWTELFINQSVQLLGRVRLFATPWTANTCIEKPNLGLLWWSSAWDFPFQCRGKTSIPDGEGGAKIPHASRPKNPNKKQKQHCNKFNKDFKKWSTSPQKKNLLKNFKKKRANLTPQKMLSWFLSRQRWW